MRVNRWDQVCSTEDTKYVVGRIARLHLGRCGCHPLVDSVRSALDIGDTKFLASFEIPYAEVCPETAEALSAISGLFSKRQDLGSSSTKSRRANAMRKFVRAETLCKETNHIFKLRAAGKFQFAPRVERVLHHSQRKIARLLGGMPTYSELRMRFGPGATTTVLKRNATPRHKLGGRLQCSRETLPVLLPILYEMEGWVDALCDYTEVGDELVCNLEVDIVPGQVCFATKNAEEDRTIIKEPVLTGMVQLGILDEMSSRLSRGGINLRDQSRNQRLARLGSLSGALATLDLSSASDCNAIELVYDQLPLDWAHMLSRFRSGVVEFEGNLIQLEKFSSMGNGFTFPLETLIFYGITCGACEETGCSQAMVSVYGDDIIVPTEAYDLLCECLVAVGFLPNRKKSFSTGPFRESCGKDYYLGIDIRPFFLKGPVSGEELFKMHNFAARKGDKELCNLILSFIDRSLYLWGPDGYGDGHLVGDFIMRQKAAHLKRGFSGYVFDTFTKKGRKCFRRSHFGDRVLPVYSTYASPMGELWVPVNDSTGSRRHRLEFGGSEMGPPEYRRGVRGVPLPGTNGYHRISIYTLT